MSPSRVGSSRSSSWRIFSSARLGSWPFPFSSKISLCRLENRQNTGLFYSCIHCIFCHSAEFFTFTYSYITWFKTLHICKLPSYLKTFDNKNLGKNEFAIFWHTYCRKCQLGFSSKIKVPQLGSARNLHSSGSLEPENSSSNSSLLSRDVSTGATGVTAVAPKFSDTLTLFQPGEANSAHHWHGCT